MRHSPRWGEEREAVMRRGQDDWLRRLERDHENVRAAALAVDRERAVAMRLAAAVEIMVVQGDWRRRRWLRQALRSTPSRPRCRPAGEKLAWGLRRALAGGQGREGGGVARRDSRSSGGRGRGRVHRAMARSGPHSSTVLEQARGCSRSVRAEPEDQDDLARRLPSPRQVRSPRHDVRPNIVHQSVSLERRMGILDGRQGSCGSATSTPARQGKVSEDFYRVRRDVRRSDEVTWPDDGLARQRAHGIRRVTDAAKFIGRLHPRPGYASGTARALIGSRDAIAAGRERGARLLGGIQELSSARQLPPTTRGLESLGVRADRFARPSSRRSGPREPRSIRRPSSPSPLRKAPRPSIAPSAERGLSRR